MDPVHNTTPAVADDGDKYILSINNFEGPLDLLWDLIKRAKLDIMEISIAQITQQYIAFLQYLKDKKVQVASEFIVMASELLYYKSRALLPSEELADEFFVPPLPPDLIQKLLEYKKYEMASSTLQELNSIHSDCFRRVNTFSDELSPELYIEVSLFDLLKAFVEILDNENLIDREGIVFDEILVSDCMDHLKSLLEKNEYIIFDDIFTEAPTRIEIVAFFLAMLEMAKSGMIRIVQHRVFGDIRITRGHTIV